MLQDFIARVDETIDRRRWKVLAGLSAAFLAVTLVRAYTTPFGPDEIVTILGSTMPSRAALWAALGDGMDETGPLYAITAGAIHAVTGVGPLATRLPAIAAFWIAAVMLFVMVRRRANALIGLSAALLLTFTALHRLALEARGYAPAAACLAAALYAWTEAAAGRRRLGHAVLLAGALAAGVWWHYYAALAFLPVLAGEVARWKRDRRPDWFVWVAVAVAAAITLPLVPLVWPALAADRGAGAGLAGDVFATYGGLLSPMATVTLLLAWLIVVAIALGTIVLLVMNRDVDIETSRLPPHETAAGLAVVALPAIGAIVGLTAGGVAVRDVAFAAPGLLSAGAVFVYRFTPRPGMADIVLAGAVAASFGAFVITGLLPQAFASSHPVRSRPALARALEAATEPVVVAGGPWALQLSYYASRDWSRVATVLADADLARELTGSDAIDRRWLALAKWTAADIEPFYPYIAIHKSFLVYQVGADWVLGKLGQQRAVITEIEREPAGTLFRVRLREPAP